jgi:hypothetical protein
MDYYFSKGKIKYKEDGWIILLVPNSIIDYYKSIVEKLTWKKISTSFHSPHVTILPAKYNGDFRKHHNWCLHNNEEVEFKYYSTIYTDKEVGANRYFWLEIECPMVSTIRKEFGLNPNLRWPLHATIGFLGY